MVELRYIIRTKPENGIESEYKYKVLQYRNVETTVPSNGRIREFAIEWVDVPTEEIMENKELERRLKDSMESWDKLRKENNSLRQELEIINSEYTRVVEAAYEVHEPEWSILGDNIVISCLKKLKELTFKK